MINALSRFDEQLYVHLRRGSFNIRSTRAPIFRYFWMVSEDLPHGQLVETCVKERLCMIYLLHEGCLNPEGG